MIEIKEDVIVVRCPHCNHFAFELKKDGDHEIRVRVRTKCRHCKRNVSYPEEAVGRQYIREKK
jgi:transposase-like protein